MLEIIDSAAKTLPIDSVDILFAEECLAAHVPTAHLLPGGEQQKNWASVEKVLLCCSAHAIHRYHTLGVAGGGAFSDMVGMAASIYHRGVAWRLYPSTWLSMVDAAVGGKTAINVGGIKNVCGSFHPPQAIVLWRGWEQTLTPQHWNDAACEMVKHALIANDPSLLPSTHVDWALVVRHLHFKKGWIASDPYDHSTRRALNYGHTVGHALEVLSRLSHGQAVGWGLIAELLLVRPTRFAWWCEKILPFLQPCCFPEAQAFHDMMLCDKKTQSGQGYFLNQPLALTLPRSVELLTQLHTFHKAHFGVSAGCAPPPI